MHTCFVHLGLGWRFETDWICNGTDWNGDLVLGIGIGWHRTELGLGLGSDRYRYTGSGSWDSVSTLYFFSLGFSSGYGSGPDLRFGFGFGLGFGFSKEQRRTTGGWGTGFRTDVGLHVWSYTCGDLKRGEGLGVVHRWAGKQEEMALCFEIGSGFGGWLVVLWRRRGYIREIEGDLSRRNTRIE